MLFYCLKCKKKKNRESENTEVVKTKSGRIMILLNGAICSSQKSIFNKEQGASGILRKMLATKIPVLGDMPIADILF